ncbi:uncharacterized protein [Penaeus vannamei]|uniref:uncharacterized protein isoform X1 n=1 Tax=Penaeus vannamei TaxID=6689 RepID=UPI00387F737F
MYCGVILTLVAVAAKESAERGNIVMKMMIMMIQARRGIVKIPSSLNSPHVLMMAIMMVYQTDKVESLLSLLRQRTQLFGTFHTRTSLTLGECLSGDLHLPLEQALRTQPPLPRPDASDTPEGGSNFYTRGEPPHKRTLLITRSERERQRTDDDTQGLARHLSALGTLKDRGFIGILYLPSVINLQFRISFIHVHYGHPFSFISGAKRWSYVHN